MHVELRKDLNSWADTPFKSIAKIFLGNKMNQCVEMQLVIIKIPFKRNPHITD